MNTIINDTALHFLNFNNSITQKQKITKDMLNQNNELQINFDKSKIPNDRILAIYWKFYNLDIKDCGFLLSLNNKCNNYFREFNYYSLIKSYQHLDKILNDNEKNGNNYIFMESFAMHPTSIFKNNDSFLRNDVSLSLLVKKDDNFVINENCYIEYVIQYKLDIDNLPDNLKILEICLFELERPFTNLPIGLEKIKIMDYVDVKLINKFFPKIPFECKIVNNLDEEII